MRRTGMSQTKESYEQEQKRRQHIEKMKELLRDDYHVGPGEFASLEEEEKSLEQILFTEEFSSVRTQ
jgi:hypothetical protein